MAFRKNLKSWAWHTQCPHLLTLESFSSLTLTPTKGAPQPAEHVQLPSHARSCPRVLVCSGCHNIVSQTGWLNQRRCIFSWFWQLEVQDQVLAGLREGTVPGIPPWLVNSYLLPVSSRCLPSVHVCVLISSSYKDTSHIGLGSIHRTSFYLHYLFKGPVSKYSHIVRYWGWGFQYEFLGNTVQPLTLGLANSTPYPSLSLTPHPEGWHLPPYSAIPWTACPAPPGRASLE